MLFSNCNIAGAIMVVEKTKLKIKHASEEEVDKAAEESIKKNEKLLKELAKL